jgi:ferric-dicitrate binding protein FerR (iron transport regulator)
MNRELIDKYLNNRCTEDELKEVLAWFESSGDQEEAREYFRHFWESLKDDPIPLETDYNKILDAVHHRINLQKQGDSPVPGLSVSRSGLRDVFIRQFRNAAAILLVPVLGLSIYFFSMYNSVRSDRSASGNSFNEVFSSVDAITKVLLPDSSVVWLNHSSSLRYPVEFGRKERNVELKGEGYFEVASNPGKPFMVKADNISVVALGTTFNIMAYPGDNRIETSLIEGRVELRVTSGKEGSAVLRMNPEDMIVYTRDNGEMTRLRINDDRYFSWKDGKLVFTAEPLSEVVKKLNRWFNADIEILDPRVKDLTLTATFINESLTQVLDLISMVSPVKYTVSGRDVSSNGTFTRREVTISYREE